MAFSVFKNVSVVAVSVVVPSGSVSLESELQYYGENIEQARRLANASGLHTRRVAPDGVTASDLCFEAAQNLLVETGVAKEEIGALIFVSHSPDYLLPASAAILQGRLELSSECATLDMNVGCAGFVKGLWIAAGLIASSACTKVLLLVGDTPNRFLDTTNRVTTPVFGDAGTATLLEFRPGCEEISFLLGSNGNRYEALVIPGGGSRIPPKANETPTSPYNQKINDTRGNPWTLGGYGQIWMDGMAIYSFGVSVIPPHIRRHLDMINGNVNELDFLLLHQANKVIVEGIGKKVGMDLKKVPCSTLGKFGNLGSSSLPSVICDCFAPESINSMPSSLKKVMLCGFGAGLAWGSCVLSLEHTRIIAVQDYKAVAQMRSRENMIAYWHNKFCSGS